MPRTDPSPSRLSAYSAVLILSALVVLAAGAVLAGAAYLARNPDYACHFVTVDAHAFGIDPSSLGSVAGSWSWWPVGLTCAFPTSDGGVVWVGPQDPILSLVLVLGVLGTAGLITGVIGVAVSRRGASRQDLR